MTTPDLPTIEAACAAATPGPWSIAHDRNDQPNIYGPTHDEWIALLPHQCVIAIEQQANANARFIALARTAVPELIAEVKRLRYLVKVAADRLEMAVDYVSAEETLDEEECEEEYEFIADLRAAARKP